MDRTKNLLRVTKHLIIMTGLSVGAMAILFGVTFFLGERLMLTLIAFTCGIIGGFVSMQQRIRKLSEEEIALLAESFFQIVLVPIFGGVFALVLYCMFLSGILSGHLFPTFFMPSPPPDGPDTAFISSLLLKTYPATGPDLAKFLFWSFVAGFSERFVPQFVTSFASTSDNEPAEDDAAPEHDADTPAVTGRGTEQKVSG
jgi:hypothetical protein